MPKSSDGKHIVTIVHETKPNGDVYVIEREQGYDPERGYTRIYHRKLLGKIPKGETEMVPTRPKAPPGKKKKPEKRSVRTDAKEQQKVSGNTKDSFSAGASDAEDSALYAYKRHTSMMDIVSHIGKISGIDDAVYEAAGDPVTAKKILSLAQYALCVEENTFSGIEEWQLNHPLPYPDGLTEEICHDLFWRIGKDVCFKQRFFYARARKLSSSACIAYPAAVTAYSKSMGKAADGYEWEEDSFKTIRYLIVCSAENGQPLAFMRLPEGLSDVLSVESALDEMDQFDLHCVNVCFSNGFCSPQNTAEMLLKKRHFLMPVKSSLTWVKEEIDRHQKEIDSIIARCPFDPAVHGIAVPLSRTFPYTNGSGGKRITENVTAHVYLHIFQNLEEYRISRILFEKKISDLKSILTQSKVLNVLSETDRKLADRYLLIKQDETGLITEVNYNSEACAEKTKHLGFFAILSNAERDPFQALREYRRGDKIEDFFHFDEGRGNGKQKGLWKDEALDGRMFVQFVALCYREYLLQEIDRIKTDLETSIADEKDPAAKKTLEKKLLAWMNDRDLHAQLTWFDAMETDEAHKGMSSLRWNPETLKQDNLYLSMLGLPTNSGAVR